MNISLNSVSRNSPVKTNFASNLNFKINSFGAKDTISFSAKLPKERNLSNNVQSAMEFAQSLLDKMNSSQITIKDVQSIASNYSEDVSVLPLSAVDEKHQYEDTLALFLVTLNSDFKPSEKEIYLNLKPQSKTANILFAMDAAHEYTHVKQIESLNTFEYLKQASDGNYDYARLIMNIGDMIFRKFNKYAHGTVLLPLYLNPIDLVNSLINGRLLPRKANVSVQSLIKAMNVNTLEELKQSLRDKLDVITMDIIDSLINQPSLIRVIPADEDINDFSKKVMKYCALKAQDEKEANIAGNEIARRALKTDKTLNLDILPIYYGILEDVYGSEKTTSISNVPMEAILDMCIFKK